MRDRVLREPDVHELAELEEQIEAEQLELVHSDTVQLELVAEVDDVILVVFLPRQ